MNKRKIEFFPYSPELAHHFKSINQQWIEEMFEMEETDNAVLNHPQKQIIEPGGQIFFAKHPDHGIVGTCALMKQEDGVFELTKMGVLPSARGLKVGEALLRHALEQAEEMGIPYLFLLTNKDCQAAIHLYEKLGFKHSQEVMDRFGEEYDRCDVAMKFEKASNE